MFTYPFEICSQCSHPVEILSRKVRPTYLLRLMLRLQADHRPRQDRSLLQGPDVVRASAEGDPRPVPCFLEDS